ncbi:MAG: hypothetical protein HOW73_28810 [Polyangiaceae bacterium]|nr:hypothetical protein [Polyangiaceae bacterium]
MSNDKKKLDVLGEVGQSCHYFSGLGYNSCRAGVRYADVRVEHVPLNLRTVSLPCFPDDPMVASCAHFRLSTPEEVAEQKRSTREAIRRINSGRSPCCEATLVPVGGGWEACSACEERVVHRYRGASEVV